METQHFLGCSGFYYNHWKGLFYPEKLSKSNWLLYYTQFFNSLEVNSTFYRFPSEKLLNGWYQKTPESFTFTLKANRIITHLFKFNATEEYIKNFYNLASLLHEKLLGVLFQLPPTVQKSIELLEKINSQLDGDIMNVLEFRHESWWDSEVYDYMKKHGLVFCSVSASGLPQTLIKTGQAVYVRFHGKNGWYKHFYPEDELADWAQKIKQQNAKQVLCYFNNDFNANATKNCLTLKKLLVPQATPERKPLHASA
ncbi:MAG: DUF72 domain-containing protein [Candidatus Bathyarchaeota archaeon]|nr:DUF72 domain-containing protein [Candidatus Bathyarchaeota archaeon]